MPVDLFPPSPGESDDIALKKDAISGRIRRLRVQPAFWSPKSHPVVLFFESWTASGKLQQRGAILISGSTGKLTIQDRTVPQKPRYEVDRSQDKDNEEEEPVVGKKVRKDRVLHKKLKKRQKNKCRNTPATTEPPTMPDSGA